jgi:GH24 family phage-related lysozyme (muramidase)
MKPNPPQMKRVAQHLNSLRIDEKYRKVYLGCLDPAGGRRPSSSDCAKVELIIAQRLAARASSKFALVGLGASGKDPILVARDGAIILGLAGKPIKDSKPNPPKRFSEVSASAVMREIERSEGRVSHMYFDTAKKVTIGVGHLLERGELSGLRMVRRKGAPPQKGTPSRGAFNRDKMADYDFLDSSIKSKITSNTTAADQTRYTQLDLAPGEVERLFRQDYREHRDRANRLFPLTSLPPGAQIGLIDLVSQTGGANPTKFKTASAKKGGWPAFTKAMERRDWKTAGKESSAEANGNQGMINRNSRRRALFEKAARQFPFHRSLTKKRKLLDLLVSSSSF